MINLDLLLRLNLPDVVDSLSIKAKAVRMDLRIPLSLRKKILENFLKFISQDWAKNESRLSPKWVKIELRMTY